MNPWIGYPATVLVTFILSYAFHGTWKVLVNRIKAPLYREFQFIHIDLQALAGRIPAELKDDVNRIIAKIERVLPLK